MDPKEPRSRSPSLLDAGAHEASSAAPPNRILSGLQKDAPPSSVTNRPRRWLWPSVLVVVGCAAVLLLVLGGAFDGTDSAPATRMVGHGRAVPVASREATSNESGSVSASHGGDAVTDASPDVAVILPGSSDSTGPVAVAAPAPATSASRDAVALSEIFTPASERKHVLPPRRVVRRASTTGDSDVALLTALIQHVEVGSPSSRRALERIRHVQKPADSADGIEVRMQACPAANTEAGLRCRQKLCAGHSGQTAACPASTPGGA